MKKIIICPGCQGYGSVEQSECISYHKGEYDRWRVACKKCKGAGRVEEVTTVNHRLFVPPKIEGRKR